MSIPLLVAYGQGVGSMGADDINTLVRGGALSADLQTFAGFTNMTVLMLGYNAPNDGGQGFFYWNGSWTGTPDLVNSIQPNGVLQGAWIRLTGI